MDTELKLNTRNIQNKIILG